MGTGLLTKSLLAFFRTSGKETQFIQGLLGAGTGHMQTVTESCLF